MPKLPIFRLFGDGDAKTEAEIQPKLQLRDWIDLKSSEKEIAIKQLVNNGWLNEYSKELLTTISYMNHHFLRVLPGKRLHDVEPENSYDRYNQKEYIQMKAAYEDFKDVLLNEKSSSLVYRMLSKLASEYIDWTYYDWARKAENDEKRGENLNKAFEKFNRLANCLNHIFEQFSINIVVTRSGFVPRQDDKILEDIYIPTLNILSDPKWKSVSDDLKIMFEKFKNKDYQETITIAHRAVQRFFQILVSEEGKNGKGELKELFRIAKDQNIVSSDRFVEPMIEVISKFLPAERAKKSTAKPNTELVKSRDALLVMNVLMVLFQHCLHKSD